VLEGFVQRSGDRLRVNVQSQLWADPFDKPVADLFENKSSQGWPTN
jgi:TolB-like protein